MTTGTSSATPVELTGWFLALVGVSFVVGIITILLFRSAFVVLRGSAEAFSSPVSLVTVGLVGLALLVPALVVLLIGLAQDLSCLNSNPPVMPLCPIGAWVLVGAVVLLVAAVLALVGAIGLILGIWRLGTRYDNSLFSVGAILLIIPYVSVVGYLLILIAARGELGRFSRPGGIPPSF